MTARSASSIEYVLVIRKVKICEGGEVWHILWHHRIDVTASERSRTELFRKINLSGFQLDRKKKKKENVTHNMAGRKENLTSMKPSNKYPSFKGRTRGALGSSFLGLTKERRMLQQCTGKHDTKERTIAFDEKSQPLLFEQYVSILVSVQKEVMVIWSMASARVQSK